MFGVLDDKVRSVDTRGVPGTFVIGVSFIFIAYFLHPFVESAYHRVRAYRAWRALEMRQAVEVTNYPMMVETLGGRGKWDTARIITVLLAVFSLFSWGLELSINLAQRIGKADPLNQPPPVTIKQIRGVDIWEVNPKEDFTYDKDWKDHFNMKDDHALSLYDVTGATTCRNGRVKGDIRVAFWSDEPDSAPAELYYNQHTSANATVKNLECAQGQKKSIDIHVRDDIKPWGTVVTCDHGPTLSNLAKPDNDAAAPPALILNSSAGETFLIVEESSNYPSFLYSVWKSGTKHSDSVELIHVFHIAATMRLAEAVVTAIVHKRLKGFECFSLVRENSESGEKSDTRRAKPFGENPIDEGVQIEDLETLECGLEMDLKALICLVFLSLLTTVGITWSFCLRSSIGMNVYDRDELIRAVSMSVDANSCSSPSAIRIFVRKEDSGCLRVVISDTGDEETGCRWIFRRRGPVVEDIEPDPNAIHVDEFNSGGAAVPVGRPAMWLRTGKVRHLPGPKGNGDYPPCVSLAASPVPSSSCFRVTTPIYGRSPHARVPREVQAFPGGRGPSVLFDGSMSTSDSGEDEPGGMQPDGRNDVDSRRAPGACVVAPWDPRVASAMPQVGIETPSLSGRGVRTNGLPQRTHLPHIMVPRLSGRGVRTNGLPQSMHSPHIMGPKLSDRRRVGPKALQRSSMRSISQASTGSSPVPPLLRDSTLGPAQLGPLTRGSGDETKEHLGDIDGVENEGSPPYFKDKVGNV